MKKKMSLLFLTLGVLTFSISYLLGFNNTDCGCGCCGTTRLLPNKPMLLIKGLPKFSKLPDEFCSLVNCSIPTVPSFIDLYVLSAIFLGISLILSRKAPKTPTTPPIEKQSAQENQPNINSPTAPSPPQHSARNTAE